MERDDDKVIPLHKRPEPPSCLTPEQAETWRMVLAGRAGDIIPPEAHPVLIEYCRAVSAADAIAEQVDDFDMKSIATDGGLKRWDRLLAMQDRAAAKVASLATKLRMTPQSRMRATQAGKIGAKGDGQRKPWETTEQ